MKDKLIINLLKYSRIVMLALIIIVLSILSPNFLTKSNILNVVTQQAPFLMILSFGMTLAIITNGIDISMSSILALSSCLAAYFIKNGNIALGIIIGLATGAFLGSLNGILITKVGLSPFIATYGIDWISRGLAYVFMGGAMIYEFSDNFRIIGTGTIMGVSNLVFIAVVIFGVILFALKKGTYGRNIYSIGNNVKATKLSGVNTDKILISVYTINGLLAAIAGILYIARLNAAEAVIGDKFTMNSMAATLIGGTSFGGGKGGVGGTVIGVLIMVFITNGMNILGVSSLWQDIVFGAIILFSIILEKVSSNIVSKLELRENN